MATEHEFKYVLNFDPKLALSAVCCALKIEHIEQGYLSSGSGNTVRIRCITKKEKKIWFYTFKRKIKNRVIEIETKISSRDGQDFWEECKNKLSKKRHTLPKNIDGSKWEIDFFYDEEGKHYFAMAEIELEEGSLPPKKLPPIIKDHLLYEVPLTDDRFSNKRLANVQYTKELYKTLKESHENR